MTDCLIIGYHENEVSGDELELAVTDLEELPAPLRSLRRTNIGVDGAYLPYLEGLSHLYGGPDSNLYTVAELPSLGTLYLVNYLRKHGRSADFINCFTYDRQRLAAMLADGPRSVAITTTFYMAPGPVIDIVRFIREHNTEVPIIVGGPLIDNSCRGLDTERLHRMFDRMGADIYVWESQGEWTLHGVVSAIVDGTPVSEVPNSFYRNGASWEYTGRRPEVNNLNECSVDWRNFDRNELGPTLSTRTARSCAFSCAFCDYPERAGALTLADISTVEKELEALAELGVRRVAFIDDTFNVPMRRFKDLCRMMVRRDFGIEWFSYFRCGHAREPGVYDLMYDAGCRGVLLGIESGNDVVLKNMDKRATTKDYRYGIEQLRQRDIFVHASFVLGFPGESTETVTDTINFLNETRPNTFAVNHWYYLHSTPVHVRAPMFELTGNGYHWKHRTMHSAEALDQADRVFESVTGASWMPVNGLDFWGVPYLLGKGMSPRQVTDFLDLAKPLTPAVRAQAGAPATGAAETRMRDFCSGLSLVEGRYRKEVSLTR